MRASDQEQALGKSRSHCSKPSKKQIKTAQSLADAAGVELPEGACKDNVIDGMDCAPTTGRLLGGGGQSMVTLEVPETIYASIPAHVRSQGQAACDQYLHTALDVGLKSMSYAGASIDTSAVRQILEQFGSDLQRHNNDRLATLESRVFKQMDDMRVALNVDKILEAQQTVITELQDRSTMKGRSFEEDAYFALVKLASVFGDRVEPCGDMWIDGTRFKQGDQLIFVHQPGAPQLKIVVEQKAGRVSRATLLEQMTAAMENRGAAASIGLLVRKHIPKSQSAFEQHGPLQIIVGVEWTDDTDWFALEVAYRTLRSQLIASAFSASSELDANALQNHIQRIKQDLDGARKVKITANAARKNLESIRTAVVEMEERIRAELTEIEGMLRPATQNEDVCVNSPSSGMPRVGRKQVFDPPSV